jgi:hypothetical protein
MQFATRSATPTTSSFAIERDLTTPWPLRPGEDPLEGTVRCLRWYGHGGLRSCGDTYCEPTVPHRSTRTSRRYVTATGCSGIATLTVEEWGRANLLFPRAAWPKWLGILRAGAGTLRIRRRTRVVARWRRTWWVNGPTVQAPDAAAAAAGGMHP